MTDGHCFISYTNAKTEQDAIQLATKLADKLKGEPPHIDVWIDNRSIQAGNWDEQVSEAIKNCKCVLFVVSPDSATSNSICADELDWALRYKKTIIPIIAYQDAEVPFRLSRRKFVDFTGNFEIALSQLRNLLAWLDTPEGELQKLKDRLGDAQRDLRRYPEQTVRIEKEIEELTAQIQVQERVVADPEEAKRQTEQKIQNGLERERQPEMPLVGIKSSKFINPPPGIAPNYFQDRTVETKQVFDFLKDDAQRMFTIVGRGGVGKTAMICRLLKHLENSALPEDVQKAFPETKPISIDGIVYLSESGSHRVNFANIFYDLCKLLPKETAQELDSVYKNPQGSTESKMRTLLEKFAGEPIALLLDNFEPLVDAETFEIRDAELNEALLAFLNGAHTSVNIVITTRIAPKVLNLVQPGRQRVLQLDDGLESPYAENILRDMDADGRMGLKSALDALLNRARERTRGYPRALEALFAILASDRYTSLEELLEKPTPENVVQELVGEAFNRLDTNAQKVMQALAVYNRPVTPAAVDYLLAPHIPAMDSTPILQRLANMHFARKESGRFYLHPVDREFAFGLIPEKDLTTENTENTGIFEAEEDVIKFEPDDVIPASDSESISEEDKKEQLEKALEELKALLAEVESKDTNYHLLFTKHDLISRAADYFAQARKPRAEWKKLDDLSAQLAEFDLRCAAGDYDAAGDILSEFDYDCLQLWGHYHLLINYYESIKEKIKSSYLKKRSLNELGLAYNAIGNMQKCIQSYEKALEIAKEEKDSSYEGILLCNLGSAHFNLGDARKANEFYEESLVIAREGSDRRGEGVSLGSLGGVYANLGDVRKAIEFYEQSLIIARETGNYISEVANLGGLGGAYSDLGNTHKAIEFYEQALVIAHGIGNRISESANLGSLGGAFSDLGDARKAIEFYEQALVIDREIGDRRGEGIDLGNIAEQYINLGEYELAIQSAEQYLRICEEIKKPASYAYRRLAQAYLHSSDLSKAKEAIGAALNYDETQNNHTVTALHGIITLRQGDASASFQSFTRAIAQADEILAKTPEYYSALDAKGLSICGLILCRCARSAPNDAPINETGRGLPAPTIDDAIETFRKARKIAPHAGVVKRNLRLFDELMKCEGGEILKDVRNAVEGIE